MDLRVLKYFLTIAQEQNITHAAKKLHMAQPPLSRQLQLLEDELNTPLFLRGKKKLELTPEGRILKERAEQILQLVDKTVIEVSETAEGFSGTVYIGATETISSTMLPRWIAGFREQYPKVNYNVWSGNSDDVIRQLEENLIDFAIVREPYSKVNLNGIKINKENWCALISADSKIGRMPGDTIHLSDMDGCDIIVPSISYRKKEIEGWFESAGCTVNIFCEYSPIINSVYLVEQNVGIAILPSSVKNVISNRNLILKKIVEPEITSNVVILTNKSHILSQTAGKFLDFIQENAQSGFEEMMLD